MLLVTFAIYIFTFIYAQRRYDNYLFLPSVVFAGIITVGQIVYWSFYTFSLYQYFSIGSLRFDYDPNVYILHWVFLLVNFFAIYRVKNEDSLYTKGSLVKKIKSFFAKDLFPLNQSTINTFIIYFTGSLIMTLYHFSKLPTNIFLSNDTYKLLGSPLALGLPFLASIIHFAAGVLAIQYLILIILLSKSKRYVFATLLIPFFVYYFLLKLADNSRWAPLIVFFALPFLYKRGSLKAYFFMFLAVCATFTCYLSVISGRKGGSFTQGLLAVWSNIQTGFGAFFVLLPKIMGTAFGSSWNLDLGLIKFGTQTVNYDFMYKILAFSPLLSSMDGFDNLSRGNILKVLSFAPVGFIGELYFFGPVYFIGCCIFLTLAIRYCNKIVIRHGIYGLITISPLYIFFFHMQQYPIRDSFRWLILALMFGYVLDYFRKKYLKRKHKAAQYPQLDRALLNLPAIN